MTISSLARGRRPVQRTTALLATTALAGGTLAIIAPTTALAAEEAAADRPIDQSYTYRCDVVAGEAPGGLPLGTHDVGVRTRVDVPATVAPGESVSSRSTQIALTMPETLRVATVGLLSGKSAGGSSEDAAVDMEFGGDVQSYVIQGLSAPQTPIPAQVGESWVIETEGTVPVIEAPDAVGTATLSMPARFTVTATVHTEPVGKPPLDVPATMDCVGPESAERVLTTIDVVDASSTPVAKDVAAGKVGITAFGFGPKVPVTLAASGGRAPYTFAVVTKNNRTTVTIDGSTAALSTTSGGPASFTYAATDADGQVSPPATVTFEGVNNAPLVRDLHFTVGKGKAIDLWPYTRDDSYGFYLWQGYNDKQRVTYGDPSHGELSPFLTEADVDKPDWGLPTADFPKLGHKQTYTPDPDFVGTDTFTYASTDNDGESSTATITVDVVEEEAVRGKLTGLRYKCEPQDRDLETGEEYVGVTGLLNYTMGGAMAFTVDTTADIPRSVEPGETFTPAPTKVDLVMPQGLAEILVGDNTLDTMGFGQTEVGGSSSASARFVETATGREYDLPLQGLEAEGVKASWPVPSEGVRIPTVGTLDPVTAPDRGAIEVHAPETMVINSKLAPGILGAITDVWLQCAAMPDQDLLIGTTYVKGESTMTATVGPVSYGSAPVVDVDIAADNAAQGTVEVRQDGKVVGTAEAKAGKARITLPAAAKMGDHEIEVAYLGFDGAEPSSTTVTYTVGKADSSTRATVATSAYGKVSVVKVAIGSDGEATGKVEVRRGSSVVGTANVVKGRADVRLRQLPVGAHSLSVRYLGSASAEPSSVAVRAIVTKAASNVRAKVAPRKIRAKRTTAKVAVRVVAPQGLARGTVTVRLKGKVVGRAKVAANGKATVRLKKFAKRGTFRLVISYSGNRTVKADAAKVAVKVRN